jgi:hypothetical protein
MAFLYFLLVVMRLGHGPQRQGPGGHGRERRRD